MAAGYNNYDRSSVTKGGPEGWGYSNSPRDKAADRYGHLAILSPKEEPTVPKVRDFANSVQNAAWCSTGAADERRMGFPKGMFQHHKDDRNGYGGNNYYYHENSNIIVDAGATGWDQTRRGNGYANAGYGTPLGRVTNDIGTDVNYVRESGRTPPVTETGTTSRWGSGGASGVTTIDSREAAKKYRGYFI